MRRALVPFSLAAAFHGLAEGCGGVNWDASRDATGPYKNGSIVPSPTFASSWILRFWSSTAGTSHPSECSVCRVNLDRPVVLIETECRSECDEVHVELSICFPIWLVCAVVAFSAHTHKKTVPARISQFITQ